MAISNETLINRINTSASLMIMSDEDKRDIYLKYDTLVSVINKATDSSVISDNLPTFQAILDRTVFNTMIMRANTSNLEIYKCNELAQYIVSMNRYKSKNNIGEKQKFDLIYDKFNSELSKCGGTPAGELSFDALKAALVTFGMKTADSIDTEELNEDSLDDINFDIDDLFNEEETDSEEEENFEPEEIDIFDEEETESEEDENFESEEIDIFEEEDKKDGIESEPLEADTSADEIAKNDLDFYKEALGGQGSALSEAVAGVVASLTDLYKSCYSGISSPDGILTSKGLLSVDTVKDENGKLVRKFTYNHSDGTSEAKEIRNRRIYNQDYKALLYAIGVLTGRCARININNPSSTADIIENAVAIGEKVFGAEIDGRKDTTPKYRDAVQGVHLYPRMHMEFLTGLFDLNPKMREWAEENKVKHSAIRLTNFDGVKKWMEKRISDCFIKAIMDEKVDIKSLDSENTIKEICNTMSKSIKNIIVVTRKKDSFSTYRICTSERIDAKAFAQLVTDYYNSGSAGSQAVEVVVKNDGSTNDVIDIDVIRDRKKYDSSSAFSADVIDDIIESGSVPRWSSVIVGEDNNGDIVKKDFTSSYSVAIYGASGSGKGIMTSALLSSALADGCDMFYFDGKPDNGAALAKIVWDKRADGTIAVGDAPVFNGLSGGSATFPAELEQFSHGIRTLDDRVKLQNMIPLLEDNEDWPFNTDSNRKTLAEASITLNGFRFVRDMILLRTIPSNLERLPNGNFRWAVFVIDEIQEAANAEASVRRMMEAYMGKVGEREVYIDETKTDRSGNTTVVKKKDGKIKDAKNWSKDAGYSFCMQWLDWADKSLDNWENIATKSLRNSRSTLITLFQDNKWMVQTGPNKNTTVLKIMLKLAPKTVKIVGKGALRSHNAWGDDDNGSYPWYDSDVQKGKWAIAKGESGLGNDSTIVKPFKVFTTDLGADIAVPLDDLGAGCNNCWKTTDKTSRTGNRPLGLRSYMDYLFMGLQDELQQQVNNGERLPETLTPEGVLTSSLDYFNTCIKNNLGAFNGNDIYSCMYYVKPISEFNSEISEEQAEGIEKNISVRVEQEQEDARNQLDAYNNMMGNSSGDTGGGVTRASVDSAEATAELLVNRVLSKKHKTVSEAKKRKAIAFCVDFLRKRGW